MSFNIRKIVDSSLCLGCGLCEAMTQHEAIKMHLADDGFYIPVVHGDIAPSVQTDLEKLCPGIRIDCLDSSHTFCGKVETAYEGWANEPFVRNIGSSGGVITALASYLLKTKQITGVLQVGTCEGHYLYNELKVSRTVEEVFSCASSRYAPALMFDKIDQVLSNPEENYLFIGKPCDVMTLQEYTRLQLENQSPIKYWISLVCAGMPGYNATHQLVARANDKSPVVSLKYRGDGWPGEFKVQFESGKIFSRSYHDSWGQVLGRNLQFRCKICPDGIGQYADIVVGDAWHTKDGYPDFSEREGKSFILTRNEQGRKLIENAQKDNIISLIPFDYSELKQMQYYQYLRLQTTFYKLIPSFFLTGGLLKIRRLKLTSFSFVKGCKVSLGTIYRYFHRN